MRVRNRWGIAALAVLAMVTLSVWISSTSVNATQTVLVPNTEQLRFELVGNEPIAGPDGRSQVSGWTVMVFRDRTSDRCYIAFQHTNGIAVGPAEACAQVRAPR
jgi:hypothetical protein